MGRNSHETTEAFRSRLEASHGILWVMRFTLGRHGSGLVCVGVIGLQLVSNSAHGHYALFPAVSAYRLDVGDDGHTHTDEANFERLAMRNPPSAASRGSGLYVPMQTVKMFATVTGAVPSTE